MLWQGTFFGAVIGLLLTGRAWGAVVGALLGWVYDQGRGAAGRAGPSSQSISQVFFRSTFELMGHVAKSDGRVSEAEIDAARRLMQELRLGSQEVSLAIACFRAGKAPEFNAEATLAELARVCALRPDVTRAFLELQLRAALMGDGLTAPARSILLRAADRLGISAFEFAHLEAALRARARAGDGGRGAGAAKAERSLSDCYAELEVNANMSNQEITKAYRRQMSRHHPDKLVANGLPESMAQVAKEKTQRIQEAYETIRAARGMR
ncbi:MAG TPA: co-chaperone DjlA [Steroidobacteraceae bacterium]|nr:co-chaperone DjlA [Steroidobacteraceae bacterium]